ncbi:ferredoxin [Anaerosolibacter carboniphilus]|uniref:Ferredoxin n=1 Tax=Anaerosolibacter carboniphilus TaxID=1417629 RepID=A0A841KKU1_9FIRM|nr:2Fe-2S iron-sulfur cluster-binding protein [Anaerosolibacter carboniphilus]MBB6214023.1 ferredoxin [Anaerosolibacter carboniphilus]
MRIKVKFHKSEKETMVYRNTTILEAILKEDIDHHHVCGGNGFCGTCRCKILKGQENLSNPNQKELAKLGEANLKKDLRLACQALVQGDISVEV